jgi:hypothetical protein
LYSVAAGVQAAVLGNKTRGSGVYSAEAVASIRMRVEDLSYQYCTLGDLSYLRNV